MSSPAGTAAPVVSVVICVIDPDPRYFPQAVRSILEQSFRELELIVIEEPSSRDGRALLRGIDDPRLRHFMHPQRTDLVAQRNRGVELARAELVAVLDGDDVAEPTRIEKQVRYMQAHPEIGVLGSNLCLIDPEDRVLGYRHYPSDPEAVHRALRRYNPIAQPAVMYRKADFERVGGYRYRDHAIEDYELWCRFDAHGVRQANLVEPLVRYRIHPGAQKHSKLRSVLAGSIAVKQKYYAGNLDLGDRLRLAAEQLLLHAPPALVVLLFLRLAIKRRAPGD